MSEQFILLVEDNADDELLTLRAFKKNNILNRIEVARDGVEALDVLFGPGERDASAAPMLPQIVLLDLNLPRLGGLDVLRRIRENPRTHLVPVVVLTSSREEEDIVRSYSLGANAFVRKPVEFEEFIQAVRTLGIFWLLLNVSAPDHPHAI
jgi:two-component system response regulator